VVNLVKVEGTLDELRELFSDVKRTARTVERSVKEVAKTAKKTKRKLSEWQRYIANSRNHIKFKSGPRKGRLDLAKMSKAFKRSRRKK
tara:strand:- start:299 stop:562 length:264 start_codon:yes stop_codon:yes gene_type:complete